MDYEHLSDEQKQFIQYGMAGHNILVEACIGSGKTTAIQALCNAVKGKNILYLTYNKLLKLDAKARIINGRTTVTNYHGFAWQELQKNHIRAGISELIQVYNRKKLPVSSYDLLILDEYQDIDQEISEMLTHIKECRPGIQIVAVGDMCQKIYDKTNLEVSEFINKFLGNYIPMEFTRCFRIGADHAAMLGRVWEKTIVGVNEKFRIDIVPDYRAQVIASNTDPQDLLVLGMRGKGATKLQNFLEKHYPDKFNKRTLWSKINDTEGGSTSPDVNCAIFTTYDGCKGMERKVCILYDWSVKYWMTRAEKPDTRYDILRNIFCVAASRGKERLVIVDSGDILDEDVLSEPFLTRRQYSDMQVSSMFDFKHVEDVEAAYRMLDVKVLQGPGEPINIPTSDELIDLSPCIGHHQEALYFKNYDINSDIENQLAQPKNAHFRRSYERYDLSRKLLYLAMLDTGQNRYMNQVRDLRVTPEMEQKLRDRLSEHLSVDEAVQKDSSICFRTRDGMDLFTVNGRSDVSRKDEIWELKFVAELSHVHALQLALYLVGEGKETGYLWNTRTGELHEIRIPNRKMFLDAVGRAATKGRYSRTEHEVLNGEKRQLRAESKHDVQLELSRALESARNRMYEDDMYD